MLNKKKTSQQLGQQAENKALRFLQKQGLELLQRNYRCRLGEIDLIMKAHNTLVFVEVRRRANPNFGNGFASVTSEKQAKIIKTAEYYCQWHYGGTLPPCRFDVISVNNQHHIHWLPSAFIID